MKKDINQILDNPANIKIYFLPWLIAVSFILRLLAIFFVRDVHIDNEWGGLLNNLVQYKSYSLYTFDGQLIPSTLLPPIYPFFLYLIKVITSFKETNFLYSIFFIQIILSTYSVYLFYQINQNFFSNKLSLINSIIYSVVPLNIYACAQISSVNLQIIFSLLFLKFLFLILKKQSKKNILIFSIISGLLILTRGEFVLIFFLMFFFIILSKKIKLINLIKIVMVVFLVVSPYLVRNYIHFNQIFLVKSLGYNLWKGNNELSPVSGYEILERNEFPNLTSKLNNLEKNKYYEINRDNIYFNEAISNLNKDSFRYFKLFFKKLFSYYFIDVDPSYPNYVKYKRKIDINSKYQNYYIFYHIIPIMILSILSFPGLFIFFKMNKFENKCLGLYLFSNLIIFSIFFILPRYKFAILPVQIILAAHFIQYMLNKFNVKKNL